MPPSSPAPGKFQIVWKEPTFGFMSLPCARGSHGAQLLSASLSARKRPARRARGLWRLLTGLLSGLTVPGLSPLLHQLPVQFPELLQKAPVGQDTAVLGHLPDGVHQGHVPVDHQVGQDQGRRPAAAHGAVNQDLI